MNPFLEKPPLDDELMHYGVKRRSGRYPWGSGDSPFQRSGDFLSRVQELRREGVSETEIVKALGLDSTTQLRVAYSVARNDRRRLDIARIRSLQEDGLNLSEIGREMGINESTVRSLLKEDSAERMNQAQKTAEILKKEIAEKKVIDIGPGVEQELGISRQKLEEAIYMLEAEGILVRDGVGVPQVTNPGKQTNVAIIHTPDVRVYDI